MIKFTGTHTEFGDFYGRRLKALHHNFYSHLNIQTLRKQLKIYQEFYPELIEERLAAAEAAGHDPDLLLYEDLAAFVDHKRRQIDQHRHGCTIFALHENGKTFVGRNYDWLPQTRGFFEQYQLNFPGQNRYFAFSDESVYTHHTGKNTRKFFAVDTLNEHGLYIGLTFAHIDQWSYGLSPSHLMRYIAEHCQTTRQALNVFAKIPCAIPKNFLIADASGKIAVVEHAAKSYEVLKPSDDNYLIQTNHCLVPELTKIDHVQKDNPRTTSFVRYAETELLLNQELPNFQFTDLSRILRKSHYIMNDETIWSLALELSEPRFNIYYNTVEGEKHTKFSF